MRKQDRAAKRQATKGQMLRLFEMCVSSQIDFDLAQSIIDSKGELPGQASAAVPVPATSGIAASPSPFTGMSDAFMFVFWETRFPGRGKGIMQFIDFYGSWRPLLKPALPDLRERAKAMFPDRTVPGFRTFQKVGSSQIHEVDRLKKALNLGPTSPFDLNELYMFRRDLYESLFGETDRSLYDLCTSLGLDPSVSVRVEFFLKAMFMAEFDGLHGEHGELIGRWCVFFKTFVLEGNFPYGFDEDGNLLVIVAAD